MNLLANYLEIRPLYDMKEIKPWVDKVKAVYPKLLN